MRGSALASFLPWVIFWIVAGPVNWEQAATTAAIAAIILAIRSLVVLAMPLGDYLDTLRFSCGIFKSEIS